jgi:hypothetical protein
MHIDRVDTGGDKIDSHIFGPSFLLKREQNVVK